MLICENIYMIMLRYGKLLKMIKLSIIICHCRKKNPVLIPIGTALRKSIAVAIAIADIDKYKYKYKI